MVGESVRSNRTNHLGTSTRPQQTRLNLTKHTPNKDNINEISKDQDKKHNNRARRYHTRSLSGRNPHRHHALPHQNPTHPLRKQDQTPLLHKNGPKRRQHIARQSHTSLAPSQAPHHNTPYPTRYTRGKRKHHKRDQPHHQHTHHTPTLETTLRKPLRPNVTLCLPTNTPNSSPTPYKSEKTTS